MHNIKHESHSVQQNVDLPGVLIVVRHHLNFCNMLPVNLVMTSNSCSLSYFEHSSNQGFSIYSISRYIIKVYSYDQFEYCKSSLVLVTVC